MKRLCVILVMGWAMQIGFVGAMVDYPEEIPFVSTPIEVVDQMLELAEVKKGDIVYDLGQRRRPHRHPRRQEVRRPRHRHRDGPDID